MSEQQPTRQLLPQTGLVQQLRCLPDALALMNLLRDQLPAVGVLEHLPVESKPEIDVR